MRGAVLPARSAAGLEFETPSDSAAYRLREAIDEAFVLFVCSVSE